MILTPLNIQIAIIKAFYALAKKSVKYYTGLALGKNNTCLFKEIRLLRAYVDILRNFEIVGSTITCNCCVNGDYTVLLNSLTEFSEAKIQFNCDDTGNMFFDNINYPFTYGYSDVTSTLIIRFDTLYSTPPPNPENTILPLQTLTFEENCSFEPNTVSPIEVAEVIVDGTPVTINYVNPLDVQVFNWDGEISISPELEDPIFEIIPAENLDSPELIVGSWNAAHHPSNNGWLLNYSSATTTYTMLSPFDGINYANTYDTVFEQYEGGEDSVATGLTPFEQPWVTENTPAYTNMLFPMGSFAPSSPAIASFPNLITEPFITEYTQATTTLEIPTELFTNPGSEAVTTITIPAIFYLLPLTKVYSNFGSYHSIYESPGPFTNIDDYISSVDANNTDGFDVTSGGTTTNIYPNIVDATSINAGVSYHTYVPGEIISFSLLNCIAGSSQIIGSYTIQSGDTTDFITNALVTSIITTGIFTGTVVQNFSSLNFTAPEGTGSDWNGAFTLSCNSNIYGALVVSNFTGGHFLTEILYNIIFTAPVKSSAYNSKIISAFAESINVPGLTSYLQGGVYPANSLPFTVEDESGIIYTNPIVPFFTTIEGFVDDFNDNTTLTGETAEIIGTSGLNTIIEFTTPTGPSASYNDTLLVFNYDIGGDSEYTYGNLYSGGIDTTEGFYSIEIFDFEGGTSQGTISCPPTTFVDIDELLDSITNNPLNIWGFIATLDNDYIYLSSDPESLNGALYNNYYSPGMVFDYTSYPDLTFDPFTFLNGVDAISPSVNIQDDFFNPIIDYPENSYDVDGINGFIEEFNTNAYDYVASNNGINYAEPEILSQSTLTVPTSYIPTPYILFMVFYSTNNGVTFTEIGSYITTDTDTSANIVSGLSTSINADPWPGSSTPVFSSLKLFSPSGTYGSYNGYLTKLIKVIPNNSAFTTIVITTGGEDGDTFKVQLNDANNTDFGTYFLNTFRPPNDIAVLYSNIININTSIHGYTASVPFGTGNIVITAPANGGLSNGIVATITKTGTITTTLPAYIFSGGSSFPDIIVSTNSFTSGGYTPYDSVKFTAPSTTGWIYNTTELDLDIGAGDWTYTNNYSGGIDTTEGKFKVSLLDPASALFVVLYEDLTSVNYPSIEAIMDAFNDSETNYGFVFSFGNFIILFKFQSPIASFNYYDTYSVVLEYNYDSPQYTSFTSPEIYFSGGELPTLQTYSGTFENGDIGPFITDNPCTPTTVTQSCLTNAQVSKIIAHINKLVR